MRLGTPENLSYGKNLWVGQPSGVTAEIIMLWPSLLQLEDGDYRNVGHEGLLVDFESLEKSSEAGDPLYLECTVEMRTPLLIH